MNNITKNKLIHIRPGPMFYIELLNYQGCAKRYAGDIITSSFRKEILNIKEVDGFTFNCIKWKKGLLFNFYFLIYCIYFSLKNRIKNIKYDFVFTYDPLKTGIFGIVVSRLVGCKLIVEVNGVYTSPAAYLDGVENISTKIKKHMFPIIEGFVLKRADGIRLLFTEQIDYFSSIKKGKVISSFAALVDIDMFLKLPMDSTRKLILFVGFPFKLKGVDILIGAFKKIANRYPEWRLRILGWYPDPTELIACIGDHPQIEYHLPVEYSDMPMQLAECGILVLPSRTEAMGRVLVEAMAAGKPRIGANIEGIPTVINDNEDGLLFDPEDSDCLALKLVELMENEPLRRRLGENGRRRAAKEFSKEIYFQNFFRFCDDVLAGNKK